MKKSSKVRFGFSYLSIILSLILAMYTVSVGRAQESFTMTSSGQPAEGGTVSPELEVVSRGGTVTFSGRANEGYYIETVVLNGQTLFTQELPLFVHHPTNEFVYTIQGVSENYNMVVTFKRYYNLFSGATSGGTISPDGWVPVPEGASQTFTITPSSGFQITDVTVDGASVGPVTSVPFTYITSDHEIFAFFAPISHIILATAHEGGSISPSGKVEVPHGGSQTFIIQPDPGYRISRLVVDNTPLEGLPPQGGIEYTFSSVITDHLIEVFFERAYYTVTAIANEGGSIFPPGTTEVPIGGSLALVVTPDDCYRVTKLYKDGEPIPIIEPFPGAVQMIYFEDIDRDITVEAFFERLGPYTVTVTTNDGGTVVASPGGSVGPDAGKLETQVLCGENVSLQITPDDCYRIKDVKVDGQSVGPVESYILEDIRDSVQVEVIFEPIYYTVTVSMNYGGIVDGILNFEALDPMGPANASFPIEVPCGSFLDLFITPIDCYKIKEVKVGEASGGTQDHLTFSDIRGNIEIEITFEPIYYTITATQNLNGKIEPGGAVKVECGSNKTFTIAPDDCFEIDTVKVDANPVQVTIVDRKTGKAEYTFEDVRKNHTIEATFKKLGPFIITVTQNPNGKIDPGGQVTVDCGDSKTFTITPDECFEIDTVLVDGNPVQVTIVDKKTGKAEYTFKDVRANHTITATFKKMGPFTITAKISAPGTVLLSKAGSITPSGEVKVECGEDQIFTIKANVCYKIKDVKVDGKSAGAVDKYTFTKVMEDHTITAIFEKLGPFTITSTTIIQDPWGAVVSNKVDKVKVECGEDKTFTAQETNCSKLVSLTADGVLVGPPAMSHTFKNVQKDHTITATFREPGPFMIATAPGANGTMSPLNPMVRCGKDQTIQIKANFCYRVEKVFVDGASVGAITAYTFKNVLKNHRISATFTKLILVIKAKAEPGGKINPEPMTDDEIKVDDEGYMLIPVVCEDDQAFRITPDKCKKIKELKVDDIVVDLETDPNVTVDPATGETLYTFAKVLTHHKIEVSFEDEGPFTIAAKAGPGGKMEPEPYINLLPEDDEGYKLVSVLCGQSQTFRITPDKCYRIKELKVDDVVVNLNTDPNVTVDSVTGEILYKFSYILQDHKIEVTFEEAAFFIITSVATAGGTISPSGNVEVSCGSSQTFTITADQNYHLDEVEVDGLAVNPLIEYTFLNVNSNHTISVTFIQDGDINNDGKLRSNDAILALRIVAGLITPTEQQIKAADVNGDGVVRSNDAIIILRRAAGLTAPGVGVPGSSGRQVNVTLGDVHGIAGGTVTVPVMVDNTYLLAGGDICVTYDSSVLRAVDVSWESNMLFAGNLAGSGTVRIAFAGIEELSGKTLAKIEFDVLADDVSPLTLKKVELYGRDSLPLSSMCIDREFRSWAMAPERSALMQNFPNPFNPETWIPYQLRDGSEAEIRIFSLQGELVRELNLGYKPAGLYVTKDRAAYWDGKNEQGEKVASGVYFYSLRTGDFSAVKKLIVLE